MSNELDLKDFGLKTDGFVIRPPNSYLLNLLEIAKSEFGQDLGTSRTEPLYKIIEMWADQMSKLHQELSDVIENAFITSAVGSWIDKHANERGLTRKSEINATTELLFSKTNNQIAAIPLGSEATNGLSVVSEVTFATDAASSIPDVFTFVRSPGGDDQLEDFFSAQSGHEQTTRVQAIEWISDSISGTSPYTVAVDYVAYSPNDDKIVWITTKGPSPGATYYVKPVGASVLVASTATEPGTAGNAPADTITTLVNPISNITAVTNPDDVTDGTDDERDGELRTRVLRARFALKNSEDMLTHILDVPGVKTARVFEDPSWPAVFRVLVDSQITPIPQSTYNEIINKIETNKPISTQSMAVVKLTRSSVANKDYFPPPYVGVWSLFWISDSKDGSSPYTRITDYGVYKTGDDFIDWGLAGSEPTGGNVYYVALLRSVDVTEALFIDINGTLTLDEGSDLFKIIEDINDKVIARFSGLDISDPALYFDVSESITTTAGVVKLGEDFTIEAVVKVVKGAANGTDVLPISGTLVTVTWVSDNEDGSGPYTLTTDYLVDGPGLGIDWSPGGSEPVTDADYYVKVEFAGNLTLAFNQVAKLGNNNLAV